MAINYIHPDSGDSVQREPWYWVATYNDGTKLEQFELSPAGAVFHRSAEIDASKLTMLELQHASYPTITVHVAPGSTPVHFYRHRQQVEEFIDPASGELKQRVWQLKVWCIGFRQGGQYWLAFTDELNHTLFTSDKELFNTRQMPEQLKEQNNG